MDGFALPDNSSGLFRVVALGVANQPDDGVTVDVFLNGELMPLVATYDSTADGVGVNQSGRAAARVFVYEYQAPYPEPSTLSAQLSSGEFNGWDVEVYLVSGLTHTDIAGSVFADLQFITGVGSRFGDGEAGTLVLPDSGGTVIWLAGATPAYAIQSGDATAHVPPDGTGISVATLSPHVDETDTGDPLIGMGLVDTTSALVDPSGISRIGMYRPGGTSPEVAITLAGNQLDFETGAECYFSWPGQPVSGTATFRDGTFFGVDTRIGQLYTADIDRKVVGVIIWVSENIPITSAGVVQAPDSPSVFTDFTPTFVYDFVIPPGGLIQGPNYIYIPEIDQFLWLAGQRMVFWYAVDNGVSHYTQNGAAIVGPSGIQITSGGFGVYAFTQQDSVDADWHGQAYPETDQGYPIYPLICEQFGPDYSQGQIIFNAVFPETTESGVQWIPMHATLRTNYDDDAPGGYTYEEFYALGPNLVPYTTLAIPGQYGDNFAWDIAAGDAAALPLLARRHEGTADGVFFHHLYGTPVEDTFQTFLWPVAFETVSGMSLFSPFEAALLEGVPDDNGLQPWLFDAFNEPVEIECQYGGSASIPGISRTDLAVGIPPTWSVGFVANTGWEEFGVSDIIAPVTANIPPDTTALPWPTGSWGYPFGDPLDPDRELVSRGVTWYMLGLSLKGDMTGGVRTQVQIVG